MMNPNDSKDMVLQVKNLNAWYDKFHALKEINMGIRKNVVTAMIGPSGCGKSTLIRCFNRMNDFISTFRQTGQILFDGQDLSDRSIDPVEVRIKVGYGFSKAKSFPKIDLRQCDLWASYYGREANEST